MRRLTLCAALAVSSALQRAPLLHARRRALLRAVDDEAQTAYNPATEILDNVDAKKKGFLAPAPSPTAAAGARRAAEYLANPRFEVLSAAITLLSCAAYAFNTLNDLPDAVATALPILERAASAFFLAEYLARFYSRGFDARRGPAYKRKALVA